jgi:hypothetical protein
MSWNPLFAIAIASSQAGDGGRWFGIGGSWHSLSKWAGESVRLLEPPRDPRTVPSRGEWKKGCHVTVDT